MGDVIYSMGMSVDGYVEDGGGGYDWSAPADDVHSVANAQMRASRATITGRRMFAEMDVWRVWATEAGHPPVEAEFAAAYVATPRYVVSDSLSELPDPDATLVRRADARALVERLKAEADGPVDLSGPTLAGSLLDLVDEFRMWINPVAVGSGKPFFPALAVPLDLRLEECRTFPSGALYVRYRTA